MASNPPAIPPIAAGACTVLLAHQLPDGASHVDWLIEPAAKPARDDANQRDLIAFRLADRLDVLPAKAQIPVTRLADHRRLYLAYEGPVSGDRGTVKRLAEGRVVSCGPQTADGSGGVEMTIRWRAMPPERRADVVQRVLLLARQHEGHDSGWVVRCVTRQSESE